MDGSRDTAGPERRESFVVEFDGVVQRFGQKTLFGHGGRAVLDHIDLRVPKGRILGLLGPSGCGKTTMVNLVMGIAIPAAGEVRVMGERAPYPSARRRIGYMPQDDALYHDITAEENLRFFGTMNGLSGARLAERVEAMLAFGGLKDDRRKLVSAFSGGMRRRLSLGVALLHEPDLLVLDEPTVGLDPKQRLRIWKALSALTAQGGTVLVTTHVMDEAGRCDELALLHEGRLIADASPAELLRRTGTTELEEAFLVLEGAKAGKGASHA